MVSARRSGSIRATGIATRGWDTRVGTIELGIPKLRAGSYFPDWLLVPRRRAEQALVSVVADCYLAGVSTRRGGKLVSQLGIDRVGKRHGASLAGSPGEIVEGLRPPPLGTTAQSHP